MSDAKDTPSEEAQELARQIDAVTAELGPMVRSLHQREGVSHQAMCMALVAMAAHHTLHDGAKLTDLVRVAEASWDRALEVHARECTS